jgi:hypothetical protein
MVGNLLSQNGVCDACHSTFILYRTPYLGPKVLAPKADPDPAPADGATDVVLTAFVLDHDDDVTSVTIDLTNIGGGSGTTMYDDGINGGDVTADDNVYTVTTTIPGSVADGVKSLLVVADDPDGPTGTNYLVMTVTNPGVVDNPAGSPVGSWPTSSSTPGYYGANYQYHVPAAGSDTFTWTPTITTTGTYEVWARWTSASNRASDATYTVYHDAGSTPVPKDQRSGGGTWVSLGTYDFDGVGVEKVELGQSTTGFTIADAIWWDLQP